jgi:hypothetical protein
LVRATCLRVTGLGLTRTHYPVRWTPRFGVGDVIEIWDKARWRRAMIHAMDFDTITTYYVEVLPE